MDLEESDLERLVVRGLKPCGGLRVVAGGNGGGLLADCGGCAIVLPTFVGPVGCRRSEGEEGSDIALSSMGVL